MKTLSRETLEAAEYAIKKTLAKYAGRSKTPELVEEWIRPTVFDWAGLFIYGIRRHGMLGTLRRTWIYYRELKKATRDLERRP